ncbi:MAG: short-chain dehydrogenase [Firmicutes bacterium]|nr:short-chain dehydrogenase [Bacillota bacterium]
MITGASGGIGLALAEIFAREGYDLVLVARSEDKLAAAKTRLESRYGIGVEIMVKDLVVKDAAQEIYAELTDRGRQIDILVNNAGVGEYGRFANADWDKQNEMIQLNITALIHMTKLFLKPMLERKEGKILNVASTAAFNPGPTMAVYHATKAAVLFFSEALVSELKGSGVTVTTLCPGPTETGFVAAASMESSKLFQNLKAATPEEVAFYGYKALMRGKPVAVQGFFNRLMAFSVRLAPRSQVREMTYKMYGKKDSSISPS